MSGPANLNPPRAWIANLREPAATAGPNDSSTDPTRDPLLGPVLDPIERDALDSAVPFAAEHARRYIASAGADDGWDGPRPILLLYTVGRTTGAVRRNPVLFFDHGGERFIIGSKGGDVQHPQWFTNLVANPDVYIRVDTDFYRAVAEVVADEARAAAWPSLIARYEMFAAYQARTERQIPLVRLRRVEPVERVEPVAPASAFRLLERWQAGEFGRELA